MRHSQLKTFFRDALVLFIGILLATFLVGGLQATSTTTLILVALVLACMNVLLKPILILFALPFVIFTLGLGIWLINALLLLLTGALIPTFTVSSFPAALLGALIISIVNLGVNLFLAPRPRIQVSYSRHTARPRRGLKSSDVIDV
jgi:putative membrane protein